MREHARFVVGSGLAIVVTIALGSAAGGASKKAPAAVASDLSSSDRLPPLARDLLVSRMRDHRVDMNLLMQSVLLLDRSNAAVIARRIAEDTRLARPLPDEAALLNTTLPPKFFDLQDDLRVSAGQLAEAASKGSDQKMAEAFGRLTTVCVSCHSVYLEPPAKQ